MIAPPSGPSNCDEKSPPIEFVGTLEVTFGIETEPYAVQTRPILSVMSGRCAANEHVLVSWGQRKFLCHEISRSNDTIFYVIPDLCVRSGQVNDKFDAGRPK